jgi:DNA-binding response OmpR family regulator
MNTLALIIEDDEDLAEIFSKALRKIGYETETIPDGQDALNRLQEVVPQLVVLDINLPKVSGDKILSFIRVDQRLNETFVIVSSAEDRKAEGTREDADIVLIKPVSYHQLAELAARLYGKARRGHK